MIKGSVKQNKYKFEGKTCIIELQFKDGTTSAFTIIDREDAKRVLARRWSFEKYKGYVRSHLNGKQVKLHNFIIGKVGLDHINQNKLDNRKNNLRVATMSENNHNRPIFRNNTSGTKGISQYKDGRWNAAIKIRGKLYQRNCATKELAVQQRKEWEKLI